MHTRRLYGQGTHRKKWKSANCSGRARKATLYRTRRPLLRNEPQSIQEHLRHSRANTTANEYMQELPESVKKMVGSVYTMLKKGGEVQQVSGDLLPNATNASEELATSA